MAIFDENPGSGSGSVRNAKKLKTHLHDTGDPGVRVCGVPELVLVDVQAVLGNVRHLDPGGVRQHTQVLQQPRPNTFNQLAHCGHAGKVQT
jgi:hypothetical protein